MLSQHRINHSDTSLECHKSDLRGDDCSVFSMSHLHFSKCYHHLSCCCSQTEYASKITKTFRERTVLSFICSFIQINKILVGLLLYIHVYKL